MEKKTIIQSVTADFARFHQESLDISKAIKEMEVDALLYSKELLSRMYASDSVGGALLAKTPKIPRKRGTRIKAIPEDDEMECESFSTTSSGRSSKLDSALETSEIRPTRAKRGASVKAADIIKKQQSMNLGSKLRRPSNEGSDVASASRVGRESRSKRPKDSIVSSEDEDARPLKQSRIEKSNNASRVKINDETHVILNDTVPADRTQTIKTDKKSQSSVKRKLDDHNDDGDAVDTTLVSERSTRKSSTPNYEPVAKKANYSKASPQKSEKDSKYTNNLGRISEKSTNSGQNQQAEGRITRSSSLVNAQSSKKFKINNIINETVDADETIASMYEDAIGRPIPIMNSTMNPNTTMTLEKLQNVTVVIEPLSSKKFFNETVTIKKNSFKEPQSRAGSNGKVAEEKRVSKSKSADKKSTKVQPVENKKLNKFSELITDDESSPERKEYRVKKEKEKVPQQKRATRSNASLISDDDDDEVSQTPIRNQNKGAAAKSAYKQNALFSPYAKESVKKRVAAFEQAAGSPKPGEEETGGRVTRTKTRALAAATHSEIPVPTVAQKLARKSLAKAKKISLAKHAREYDDAKENEDSNIPKSTKKNSESLDRGGQKSQLKTTPLGKSRLQMPNSVGKTQYATPSNSNNQNAYSKALTGPRGNIVTHVDSFIQPMRSAQKTIDRVAEEKRRRAHEEDARRKREELLKAKAEEKKRKREEKELKNKLAREAKEKLEYEKRIKAEKEREEKAKLAQIMQEKQKEEMEKKRLAQLHRAQEKEERRRYEEQLRMQRLQEQEEQERLYAEQKRREQEQEKRKHAEMKHMAEMKMKTQIEKAKAKALAQKQLPYNYKIDSDPDEEESDDESKPKHQIAHWASRHVRQAQLAMQQHIPMRAVLRFFGSKKSSPDLRDLFHGIDPKKLKRSSSAVWKTPPRFSMMNCSIIND